MNNEPLALTNDVPSALAVEGFHFAINAAPSMADTDEHGYVTDAAIARIFDDSTVAYARNCLGPRWSAYLEEGGLVVVARELHLFQETPGRPTEHHVVGTRVAARRGKACVIEHRLIASDDRLIARGELVQLLLAAGRVIDWPNWYWDLVAAAEGHPIPTEPRDLRPWGPPA